MSSLKRNSSTSSTPCKKAKKDKADEITDDNRDYQAEDADITLVSADGLDFKVHKWALMASSNTFRNMIDIGTQAEHPTIELSDDRLESSSRLKIFLDLVYSRGVMKFPRNRADYTELHEIIELLLKYETTYPLEVFKYALQLWMHNSSVHNLEMFIAGSKLDSVEVCMAAIMCKRDKIYKAGTGSRHSRNDYLPGRHVLDLSAASLTALVRIPEQYKWALQRAGYLVNANGNVWEAHANSTVEEWSETKEKVAKEFQRLMIKLAEES
ncbi:uncharacterized protein L201_007283 [Kwoniella dendrophila CBS 6074]|uniref:BTB domain-containing protein n=1 Tax=Kwoniella dendrophila CBS 6074 TaxID=1295534 RepID=A0AAX4K5C8_9TREE